MQVIETHIFLSLFGKVTTVYRVDSGPTPGRETTLIAVKDGRGTEITEDVLESWKADE